VSAPLLQLDFIESPRRGSIVGVLLLVVGALGGAGVLWNMKVLDGERAGVELRLAARDRASGRATLDRDASQAQAATKMVNALSTPWSELLAELEKAGADQKDNVAVLTVEPDHLKHRVRVEAEARSLSQALAYIERLRSSPVLRYPMLDSHEIKTDDRDRPVHFELSADWSDRS
jgi:hypothetical protein